MSPVEKETPPSQAKREGDRPCIGLEGGRGGLRDPRVDGLCYWGAVLVYAAGGTTLGQAADSRSAGLCRGGGKMSNDKEIAFISPIAVAGVAFGIRYQPRYRIMDRIGAVSDQILRTPGSPFGPDVFPTSAQRSNGRGLLNQETGDQLWISSHDTVLEMRIGDRSLDKVSALAANFEKYVLSELVKSGLRDVLRFGFLTRFAECRSYFGELPVPHFLGADATDATSLDLRFTRRLPSLSARVKRDVDDYRNLIYSVQQSQEGEVTVAIDYQEYFQPELDSKEIQKKSFPRFVDEGLSHLRQYFQKWLDRLSNHEAA